MIRCNPIPDPAINGFPTNFTSPVLHHQRPVRAFRPQQSLASAPYCRVGEPVLIRILNAGLWLHSTHMHANHEFVLQHNNRTDVVPGSFDNPIWMDVYTANPLDTYDMADALHAAAGCAQQSGHRPGRPGARRWM